ncbi:MAG: FGGY-family carbohydrate kinase [Sandaracinaceae bacterium]|nr:FGGY-family carbohydrate kinase [Sandaracinaceae bacterium]
MIDGELVLAIDAGSGGARATLYDAGGERVSRAERAWHATVPPELAPFGREYAPAELANALDEATLEALAAVDPASVVGVACTGQRIACALLDAAGATLYAGPNGDVRALAGAALEDLDDDALYARTGRFPPWIYAPARARWFEANAPELHGRIRHVVGLPGWAAHRLTGEVAVDATVAADLMMLDVASGRRALVAGCLPDEAWPRLAAPTDRLGGVSDAAAARLGLRPGVPVAVGCADTQAALRLGGADTLVAGSSAPLLRRVDGPRPDPARRLWLDPTLDGFCLEANLGEMGTAHRWLEELLALPSFEAFDALARGAAVGARGASAHLGPRAMDLRALSTGRPAGLLLPFGETSLSAPPGRAEIARSFLESCAFATRAGRAWLDAVAPAPDALHLVGGLAQSALLGDVLASVLGVPVRRGPHDATARGAAACAMVVAGLASDLDDAVARLEREPAVHLPDEELEDAYDDAYERWLEREQQLEEM